MEAFEIKYQSAVKEFNEGGQFKKLVYKTVLGSYSQDVMALYIVQHALRDNHFEIATAAVEAARRFNKLFQPFTPKIIRASLQSELKRTLEWWLWFASTCRFKLRMDFWKALMADSVMCDLAGDSSLDTSDVVSLLYDIWMYKHGSQKWCTKADHDFVARSQQLYYNKM